MASSRCQRSSAWSAVETSWDCTVMMQLSCLLWSHHFPSLKETYTHLHTHARTHARTHTHTHTHTHTNILWVLAGFWSNKQHTHGDLIQFELTFEHIWSGLHYTTDSLIMLLMYLILSEGLGLVNIIYLVNISVCLCECACVRNKESDLLSSHHRKLILVFHVWPQM